MSDPDIDPVELINSRRAGFSKLLGIVVTEATPDCVKATLEVREELCTRPEVLHGGASAFADNLGALACILNLPEGARTTTLESKTNFLSSIPYGETLMPKRRRCTKAEARWFGARISSLPTVSCVPW